MFFNSALCSPQFKNKLKTILINHVIPVTDAMDRCNESYLSKFPMTPTNHKPLNNGNIIFWSVAFSVFSYFIWKEDAIITSPIWILWTVCTVFIVSSEVMSNRFSSIKSPRTESIRQLILLLLYVLYLGFSTAMVILFYPSSIPASILTIDLDSYVFLCCLVYCLALAVTTVFNHFNYIHYNLSENYGDDNHPDIRFNLFQTKQVEQLRQRNYIVMASFSYLLRIISLVILGKCIHWTSLTINFVFVCLVSMMNVAVLILHDNCNRRNIKVLFGKEIRWPFFISKVYVSICVMFFTLSLVVIYGVVFGFLNETDLSLYPILNLPKLNGYQPIFCWIFFVSAVRRDAIQYRFKKQYQQLGIRIHTDDISLYFKFLYERQMNIWLFYIYMGLLFISVPLNMCLQNRKSEVD